MTNNNVGESWRKDFELGGEFSAISGFRSKSPKMRIEDYIQSLLTAQLDEVEREASGLIKNVLLTQSAYKDEAICFNEGVHAVLALLQSKRGK